jgi:hypothetical protein
VTSILEILRRFDAFSDRGDVEAPRQIDHRLAHGALGAVLGTAGDETAIELDLGERQFLEPRQR